MFVHAGWRISRVAIGVPTGASAWSFAASEPAAWMIAPPGGIGSPPFAPTAVTAADRSTLGAVAGNGLEHDLRRARDRGRLRPERRREQDDLPLSRNLIEPVQRAALPGSLPGAEELDAVDMQRPGGVDADRRPGAERRVREQPARHEDPRRVTVGRAEEIPVDAGDGGLSRDVLLDLRELLAAAEHGPAGEHRRELKQAVLVARPRGGEHVQHHGAVRRELDLPVVGEPWEQRCALCLSRRRARRREDQESRQTAQHPSSEGSQAIGTQRFTCALPFPCRNRTTGGQRQTDRSRSTGGSACAS